MSNNSGSSSNFNFGLGWFSFFVFGTIAVIAAIVMPFYAELMKDPQIFALAAALLVLTGISDAIITIFLFRRFLPQQTTRMLLALASGMIVSGLLGLALLSDAGVLP